MSHAVDGTYIKAQQDKMVNSSLCKKASVDTYFNVMEVNLIIYIYINWYFHMTLRINALYSDE